MPTALDDPAAIIGVWATASRPATITRSEDADDIASGGFVQVSRLGSPLVNEIVLPLGQKDLWNASQPADDGQFLNFVTNPEPAALLNLLYGISISYKVNATQITPIKTKKKSGPNQTRAFAPVLISQPTPR